MVYEGVPNACCRWLCGWSCGEGLVRVAGPAAGLALAAAAAVASLSPRALWPVGQALARLLPLAGKAAVLAPSSPGRAAGASVSLPLVGGPVPPQLVVANWWCLSMGCCRLPPLRAAWRPSVLVAGVLHCRCRCFAGGGPPCGVLGLTVAVRTCQFTVASHRRLSPRITALSAVYFCSTGLPEHWAKGRRFMVTCNVRLLQTALS